MVRRRRRHRRFMRYGSVALALLSANALIYRAILSHRRFTQPDVTPATETIAAASVRPAIERYPARPVYPYSVIRGGVYSAAELNAALRQDSVVSGHYAGFHRENLRMTNASQPMPMYASYRIGNSVYWTSHPVHIAAGEPLITDGTSLARARCGNRLSESPQEPVTRMEPTEREMETPGPLDFAEPPPANTRGPDKLLDLHPPVAPVSGLAFQIFPPNPLPAVPASRDASGNAVSYAPFSLPYSTLLQGLEFRPSPQYLSYNGAENSVPPAGESTPPGEFNLQLNMGIFQANTPPVTRLKVPEVTAPVMPGVITGMVGFPYGGAPGSAVTGANPAQLVTTTSHLSPLPGGNPDPSIPGVNDAPEPVAWVLICAGVAFLWLAARRRRFTPSSR